jgi:hypothetical protein
MAALPVVSEHVRVPGSPSKVGIRTTSAGRACRLPAGICGLISCRSCSSQ